MKRNHPRGDVESSVIFATFHDMMKVRHFGSSFFPSHRKEKMRKTSKLNF